MAGPTSGSERVCPARAVVAVVGAEAPWHPRTGVDLPVRTVIGVVRCIGRHVLSRQVIRDGEPCEVSLWFADPVCRDRGALGPAHRSIGGRRLDSFIDVRTAEVQK